VPDLWLEHARFDHAAHRALECLACHQAARGSTTNRDLLNPASKPARTVTARRRFPARAQASAGAWTIPALNAIDITTAIIPDRARVHEPWDRRFSSTSSSSSGEILRRTIADPDRAGAVHRVTGFTRETLPSGARDRPFGQSRRRTRGTGERRGTPIGAHVGPTCGRRVRRSESVRRRSHGLRK
jgi:hypothetical protein